MKTKKINISWKKKHIFEKKILKNNRIGVALDIKMSAFKNTSQLLLKSDKGIKVVNNCGKNTLGGHCAGQTVESVSFGRSTSHYTRGL